MRRFVPRLIIGIIAFALLYTFVLSRPEFAGVWKAISDNIPKISIPHGGGQPNSLSSNATHYDPATASALLTKVSVAPSTSQEGYKRDDFISGWPIVDGCSVRNNTLKRDLTEVKFTAKGKDCIVASGHLNDPYSTREITFNVAKAQAVQIDHVVPLSWAHKNGAKNWTTATKNKFAIDQENLLAVDGPTNASKSDGGPAEWPTDKIWNEQAARGNVGELCAYIQKFTALTVDYGLTMNSKDHNAVSRRLKSCG